MNEDERDQRKDEQDEQREWENKSTRSNRSVHSRQDEREPRDRISRDQEADGPRHSAYRQDDREPRGLEKIQQEREDAKNYTYGPGYHGPNRDAFRANIRDTVLQSQRYINDERDEEEIFAEYEKENPIIEDPEPNQEEPRTRGMAATSYNIMDQMRENERQAAASLERGIHKGIRMPQTSSSPEHEAYTGQKNVSTFMPYEAYTPDRRIANTIRVPEGSKGSKVTAFGNPQVREKWTDNREFQCHERYDDQAWLSVDIQYVVLIVARDAQARARCGIKEKLSVTRACNELRELLKGTLEFIENGTKSDYGLQPRIDLEKLYNELELARIREELVASVRVAKVWVEDCRIECDLNEESKNGAAKGRSYGSATNVQVALVSMIQIFDELKWKGARYLDQECNEIILDWSMLWIMIAELVNILRPVVVNMQDATKVLRENADMHVRRTTNDERQYMRVAGTTTRPRSRPSLYSSETYPHREKREPPPQPSDKELEYISSTQEDTASRNSNQSVAETARKGRRMPRNPIPEPFPTADLVENHRTSKSFKERQILINPLLPGVAKDGTRQVTRVDKWRLAVATTRRGQSDNIEERAEVYARVAFASDGTSGYRACGWGNDLDTTLGDSNMKPIYHAVTDTTSFNKDSRSFEPHWLETLWNLLMAQDQAVKQEDYECPSLRGLAKDDYQFQITQHWGHTPARPGENRTTMGSFYELTANTGDAMEDLQRMFETEVPSNE
jgi:hypothetical protein